MTGNPRPRPALRKAPDATVHPAAPVGTVPTTPAAAGAAPSPGVNQLASADSTRPVHLRPVVGLGGSTSDSLRTDRGKDPRGFKSNISQSKGHKAKTAKGKSKAKAAAKSKTAPKAKTSLGAQVDKQLSKKKKTRKSDSVPLDVRIPKKLRKSLKRQAAKRDTSVDALVVAVLSVWVED